ncbi:fascin domain-containing protein [Actinacidiphila sp. ITFR-21]|uniref:fascin domain-containing protein n=1 Tax=Actinacidiphila sp. ITFR-21 TaxID=3075199 RepID=UPI00288A8978|nr:arabinofuranosidase catalytic domain-containing protein [Streptomyces sp. ITFR-21]WNI16840.1 arabinofuranosidase catalytic domain-containing protein [Streptomyces sp. ITFR-21]
MEIRRDVRAVLLDLGTGGDNSPMDTGEFVEGAVTGGFPTDATGNAVQANITAAGYANNTTTFPPPTESVSSLKAHANGKYVDAPNSTTSLIADAASVGTNETFSTVANNNGTVNQKARSDNQWVTAESNGNSPLIANRGGPGPWKTFHLVHNADGSVSFRAYDNQHLVTAENGGASALIANRTAIGPWEEFDLATQPSR